MRARRLPIRRPLCTHRRTGPAQMFPIRRIYDDVLPINEAAIAEVQQIFKDQFKGAPSSDADELRESQLKFCYLDFIATVKGIVGRGIGAALYERVRDDALRLGARGLF